MDITPFLLKVSAVLAILGGFAAKVKMVYKKLAPLVEPTIKRVEELAKDGEFNREDRKKVAMGMIADAQAKGILRQFSFFEKMIVSKVVDCVAGKLPDFKFNVKSQDNA